MTGYLLAQQYLFSIEAIVFALLAFWFFIYYKHYHRHYVLLWMFSLLALSCSYFSLSWQDPILNTTTPSYYQQYLLVFEQMSKYTFLSFLILGVYSSVKGREFTTQQLIFVFLGCLVAGILTISALNANAISLFNQFYIKVSLHNFIFGASLLAVGFYLVINEKKHYSLTTLIIYAFVMSLRYLAYSFASILIITNDDFQKLSYFLHFFDSGAHTILAFIMLIWVQGYERNTAKHAVKRASYLGKHDSLTGALNREQALEKLLLEMQTIAKDQKLAICLIDIKRFKFINDTYGLKTGDYILSEIANRLSASILMPSVVGRLSGDSFLFVIKLQTEAQINANLDHIHQLIARPYFFHNKEINISCSIGYCFYPTHAQSAEQLLQKANLALHHAESHQLSSVLFENTMQDQGRQLLLVEKEISAALINDEFVLYFQPQLNLITNRLEGVEALVRWQHPEKGLLAPNQFLDNIETLGLNSVFDNYILEKSCQTIERWFKQYKRRVTIAVNITAVEFQDSRLVANIQGLLLKYNVPPTCLDLEITENVMMTDIQLAMSTIITLQNMGIKVSIDDFGTGYSSLTYLRKLPIDKIKIDRGFISEVASNDSDLTIVKSMIELSHGLGKRVLAEGVETRAQLDLLRNLGCDAVQGFFISRPVPENELVKYLKRR
jgi:diguanylate cyclase (GGDEF)-like protein